ESANREFMLNEIVVQARRVDESIQDVPIAITALQAADLEVQGIRNFADLQYSTPSLSFTSSPNRDSTRISLRGQSTPFASVFLGVVTLFAEVPIAIGGSASFFDVASVQVLKGPQGVAFGRNSTGGAVLLYPNLPEPELAGYVGMSLGKYDLREYDAMLNLPVIDDILAIRLAGHMERRDGWTKDVLHGAKYDDKHMDEWRISIRYTPTPGFENQTIIARQDIDAAPSSMHTIFVSPAGSAATLYQPPLWNGPAFTDSAAWVNALGRSRIATDFEGYIIRKQLLASNTTIWDLNDNLTIKNIFAYQELLNEQGWDGDGTPIPLLQ